VTNELSITVEREQAAVRVDRLLSEKYEEYSRAQVKRFIEAGYLQCNGEKLLRASYQVRENDLLVLTVPPPIAAKPVPQDIALSILYEDRSLIVLNKAAGMVVHAGAGNLEGTLVNALLYHSDSLVGIGDELRPGIVHRLDRHTSGAMVVAKTQPALRSLQQQFQKRTVEKSYLAVVYGRLSQKGDFHWSIGRDPQNRLRMRAVEPPVEPRSDLRTAHTSYHLRLQYRHISVVDVRLHTGRTHQIRAHFAKAGYALVGDPLYGGSEKRAKAIPNIGERKAALAMPRQALHAEQLAFIHPESGAALRFEAPIPPDLQTLLDSLAAQSGSP